MTLSAYFMSKSVFDQQGCHALTFALARLSCNLCDSVPKHYNFMPIPNSQEGNGMLWIKHGLPTIHNSRQLNFLIMKLNPC